MSGTNGSYQVSMLGTVREAYLDIVRRAIEAGVGEVVVEAYRQILIRLARDPREFGEPMYRLRAMQMEVRKGAIRPLYIEYGVHDQQPVVVVRRVRWLADPAG